MNPEYLVYLVCLVISFVTGVTRQTEYTKQPGKPFNYEGQRIYIRAECGEVRLSHRGVDPFNFPGGR